jgi:hypothetical protein
MSDSFERPMIFSCSSGHVVQVLLHDHVAAPCEGGILVPDQRRPRGGGTGGVFGAVDKADQVAVVEVAEAVHLGCDGHRAAEPAHDLAGQFEAQVHPHGADMEQHVAGGSDGMPRSCFYFSERMEPGWLVRTGDAVPRCRTKAGDAGQVPVQIPESHGTDQAGQVRAERTHRVGAVLTRGDFDHQEDRGARERCDDRLRLGGRRAAGVRCHTSILYRPSLRYRTTPARRGGTCPAGPSCAGQPRARSLIARAGGLSRRALRSLVARQ